MASQLHGEAMTTSKVAIIRALQRPAQNHTRYAPCIARRYATENKSRNLRSHNSQEPWSELRTRGKIVRSTDWSFNLLVVLGGLVLTVIQLIVGYFSKRC
jgi:hypothetical protein